MIEETKEVIDVAAASTAILTIGAWLPPIASLFTMLNKFYDAKQIN